MFDLPMDPPVTQGPLAQQISEMEPPSPQPLAQPLPSPSSPTLATTQAVLPHAHTEHNLLADQASHLTLSAFSASTAAPSAARGPHCAVPVSEERPSRRRRRTCSAAAAAAAAAAGDGGSFGPLAPRRTRAPASSIGPLRLPVTSAAVDDGGAQPSFFFFFPPQFPISLEHAHEATDMRDADDEAPQDEQGHGHRMRPAARDADARSTALALAPVPVPDPVPGPVLAPVPVHAPSRGLEGGFSRAVRSDAKVGLADMPNEVLLHILSYLDVSDLLATSRVSGCRDVPLEVATLCTCTHLPAW